MSFNHIFFEPASHPFLAGYETPAQPRHHGRHGHAERHFQAGPGFGRGPRHMMSPPSPPPPPPMSPRDRDHPRGHHGGHHGHREYHTQHPRDRHSHHRERATPPSDFDEQERALVQQLEALRVRKAAHAEAESQRQAAAIQDQVNRVQQVVALESARHQQRIQNRIEAQLQHQARQQALIRALSAARVEAQQIERQQQRERQAQVYQAQQVYLAQQHARAEEERQRRLEAEKRKQIEFAQRQKMIQDSDSERQFWQTIERAFTPSEAARLNEWQGQTAHRAASTPAPTAPKVTEESTKPEEKDFIDVLKLIFGDDVIVNSVPKDDKKPQVERSATPVSSIPQSTTGAPKSATPAEDKPKTDSAEVFIDELFGAFASAFGLKSDDEQADAETGATSKDGAINAAQPPAPATSTSVETPQDLAIPNAETPLKSESRPASSTSQGANQVVPPSITEEEVPVSAADLEAQQAQATADLIQARYRQHLLRVKRLEKLEGLEKKLQKLDDGWIFPTKLDFLPSTRSGESTGFNSPHLDPVDSASSNSENLVVPPLAFTPLNVPYHSHAQSLLGLLVSADGISSDGDEQVRSARKDFVRKVEGKLGEMEVGRRAVWEQVRGDETVPEVHLDAPATTTTTATNNITAVTSESPEDTKTQSVPAPTVEDAEDVKTTFSDSEDEEHKVQEDGEFVMM